MPFKSRQQQKWGHTAAGIKALGGASKVHEWDQATKGIKIPAKAPTELGILAKRRIKVK